MLPAYAHPGDAGLDLYAAVSASLEPGESKLVGTGISIELPPNTEAQVRPRSGLALKHGITVLNTPGTIDHGYRGRGRCDIDQSRAKPLRRAARHEDRADGHRVLRHRDGGGDGKP